MDRFAVSFEPSGFIMISWNDNRCQQLGFSVKKNKRQFFGLITKRKPALYLRFMRV